MITHIPISVKAQTFCSYNVHCPRREGRKERKNFLDGPSLMEVRDGLNWEEDGD